MKVLVADDDVAILETIGEFLEQNGVQVDYAANGPEALAHAGESTYDVIVLDVRMPRMTGLETCEKLRRQGVLTPILFLTARDSLDDKLDGFAAGADDYLVKPFAYEELRVRLGALAGRRSTHHASKIEIGELEIDLLGNRVWRSGRPIHLNPMQFKLLRCLALRSPAVVSRDELTREVWGDRPPDSDALRTHVFRLRGLVDRPFHEELLQTVHGVGYRLSSAAAGEST